MHTAPSRHHTYRWNNTGGLDWSGETVAHPAPGPGRPSAARSHCGHMEQRAPGTRRGDDSSPCSSTLIRNRPRFSDRTQSAASIVSIEGGAINRVWRRITDKNHRWGMDVTPSGNETRDPDGERHHGLRGGARRVHGARRDARGRGQRDHQRTSAALSGGRGGRGGPERQARRSR